MKLEDAAKLLGLTGDLTKAVIKRAYQVASSKYHPDKGGSKEMMQAVNAAYEALKGFEGNLEAGDLDYADLLNDALLKIIDLPGLVIEVCGAWIWVTGDTKPHSAALGRKEGGAGFFWAKKKKSWYFRPSDWKSASRGNWSMDKIRDTHGSDRVKGKQQMRLAS